MAEHSQTDRAIFWGHGVAPSLASGSLASMARARKSQLSTLELSIRSVSQVVHDAAFVVIHDLAVNCTSMQVMSTLACSVAFPHGDTKLRPSLKASDECRLGKAALRSKRLYLIHIDPVEQQLDQVRDELFSYRRDETVKVGEIRNDRRQWMQPNRKVDPITQSLSLSRNTSRYGELLGYGAWFRYVAHRFLLPMGIRQALYLDSDTCVLLPLGGLFSQSKSAPLVVSRRAVPQWKLRYWLQEKYTDLPLVRRLWGFSEWSAAPERDKLGNSSGEVHMFNNGVMLMNLLPYCIADIWGRLRNLTRHHAYVSRIFGPLDRVKEFGDNQAIEIVGGKYSHMVGTEWNCRHWTSLVTLKTGTGVPCHIRHLHEDEMTKYHQREMAKAVQHGRTCKQIVTKRERGEPANDIQ